MYFSLNIWDSLQPPVILGHLALIVAVCSVREAFQVRASLKFGWTEIQTAFWEGSRTVCPWTPCLWCGVFPQGGLQSLPTGHKCSCHGLEPRAKWKEGGWVSQLCMLDLLVWSSKSYITESLAPLLEFPIPEFLVQLVQRAYVAKHGWVLARLHTVWGLYASLYTLKHYICS